MKRIFYGLSGEGLGHASRTLAMIDALPDYEVHVFTYGKALDYFNKLNYPHTHQIEGMMFSYNKGKVDYLQTGWTALKYFFDGLHRNARTIQSYAKCLKPDLYVADFEPSIARAAKLDRVPLVSVDNQHRFAYVDMVELPTFLRMYGWVCGLAAKVLVPSPKHTVISTFHYDLITAKRKDVTLTNGLLRKDVVERETSDNGHVLVYLRNSVSDDILRALIGVKQELRIYGASQTPVKEYYENRANFRFLPLGPSFVEDLASCNALIATAGNQLITEARYYKKRCLVVPEPGQYEQYINAFYVERLGLGRQVEAKKIRQDDVEDFLKNFQCSGSWVPNGVDRVVKVIKSYL